MDNQEKIEEILNKKFKKSIFSGYDTLDVDEYFDRVIEYIKNCDKRTKEAEELVATLKLENDKLSQQVAKLSTDLASAETLVKEFKQNGYDNVVIDSKTKTISKEGK